MKKYEKKMLKSFFGAILCASMLFSILGCKKKSSDFKPRLDVQKRVFFNAIGFFSNFEAFDLVTVDFNKYYPNVVFSYEQVSSERYATYLNANPKCDILMTSSEVCLNHKNIINDIYADLLKEDIDFSDIEEDAFNAYNKNGKIFCIPMGQNIYGIAVNQTLLKKEGIAIPSTFDEFADACKILKEKGYVPIQGPTSKVYAELTLNMACDMILADETMYKNIVAGIPNSALTLVPVLEKIDFFIENGYIDENTNKLYPFENYDRSILNFFEGDVPFWVCNSEKISGMKKRESKSEKFKENPFEYTFIYSPLGENGPYVYSEPWYGFTVNRNSENYDYAVEFIRFLATKEEINKMANIKGIPSVAKEKKDLPVYDSINNNSKAQMNFVNDGRVNFAFSTAWYECVKKYVQEKLSSNEEVSKEEALEFFVKKCSGK